LISVMETYVQALIQAGASPVIIPLDLPEKVLPRLVERLDGILFTGGGDIDPRAYNGPEHPLVTEVDPDRDRVELFLVRQLASQGTPFLGICRGLQVVNVALGGSLYEDILDQHPQAIQHQCYPEHPRDYLAHTVSVHPSSRLAEIFETGRMAVNSMHHQGVRRLAPGLTATALAPDGIIEALELPGERFALAVQWHPECMLPVEDEQSQDENQAKKDMRALFRAFVQAADRKDERRF
jgi:putative glutamine amidotransferase